MKKITKEDVKKFWKENEEKVYGAILVTLPSIGVLAGYKIGLNKSDNAWRRLLGFMTLKYPKETLSSFESKEFWEKVLNDFRNSIIS